MSLCLYGLPAVSPAAVWVHRERADFVRCLARVNFTWQQSPLPGLVHRPTIEAATGLFLPEPGEAWRGPLLGLEEDGLWNPCDDWLRLGEDAWGLDVPRGRLLVRRQTGVTPPVAWGLPRECTGSARLVAEADGLAVWSTTDAVGWRRWQCEIDPWGRLSRWRGGPTDDAPRFAPRSDLAGRVLPAPLARWQAATDEALLVHQFVLPTTVAMLALDWKAEGGGDWQLSYRLYREGAGWSAWSRPAEPGPVPLLSHARALRYRVSHAGPAEGARLAHVALRAALPGQADNESVATPSARGGDATCEWMGSGAALAAGETTAVAEATDADGPAPPPRMRRRERPQNAARRAVLGQADRVAPTAHESGAVGGSLRAPNQAAASGNNGGRAAGDGVDSPTLPSLTHESPQKLMVGRERRRADDAGRDARCPSWLTTAATIHADAYPAILGRVGLCDFTSHGRLSKSLHAWADHVGRNPSWPSCLGSSHAWADDAVGDARGPSLAAPHLEAGVARVPVRVVAAGAQNGARAFRSGPRRAPSAFQTWMRGLARPTGMRESAWSHLLRKLPRAGEIQHGMRLRIPSGSELCTDAAAPPTGWRPRLPWNPIPLYPHRAARAGSFSAGNATSPRGAGVPARADDSMKLTLERNDLVPPGTWPWWLMALTLTLLWRALLRRTSQHRSDGGIAHRRDAPYRRAVRAVERCNRESALAFPAAARVPLRARVPVADGGASRLHLRAGDWRVARPLPVPMCGAYAVVREGHLYAFSAGHSAYSASVGEGNALGPWQAVGEDMPRTTSGAAWVAGPTRIYLAPASAQREGTPLFSAAFRPGGRLGSWRLEVGLPVGLSHAALAIHDDLLVLAGGRDRRGASARVYTAPLERAGRVGRWQGTASLPSPLVGHALASAAGALLVLGGRTPDGRADASVYRALFASGTLSGWMECAGLPSSRAQAGVATHQGAVLVFGGESRAPHDDVLVGDAGQWRAASLRLPSALCGAAAAVSDHALFLLGGQDRQRRTDVATRVLVYAPALAGHAWPT